jgi:glycosyltransferase involved in cell wall biosynthesis
MKILFIHQNFPAQYRNLAPALVACGHVVHALTLRRETPRRWPAGVTLHFYELLGNGLPQQHVLLRDLEPKALRGEAVAAACAKLAHEGFSPDVICAHPGWGEALFLRDVWPTARQIHYLEYFYATQGLDVGFDPEGPPLDLALRCRITMKKSHLLQALNAMDHGVSPTAWQASTFPSEYASKLSVIHDGIDTTLAAPRANASFTVQRRDGSSLVLGAGDEVVSYVARNLEPSRGYHRFMRAVPEILTRRPEAHVIIVGGNRVSYSEPPAGGSYQEQFFAEIRPQLSDEALARLHFTGRVSHAVLMSLFQITRAHVYLTYPFVLSWSLLEAMSCGAPVVASGTGPVLEVVADGVNGRLVDFFDAAGLAEAVIGQLSDRRGADAMGREARATIVQRYDHAKICLPGQIALIERFGSTAL